MVIKSATQARCWSSTDLSGNMILTPYSYSKAGPTTANFTYVIQQYINGPIRNRKFERTGIIEFQSPRDCIFTYQEKYWADGVLQHDIPGKLNWTFGKSSDT